MHTCLHRYPSYNIQPIHRSYIADAASFNHTVNSGCLDRNFDLNKRATITAADIDCCLKDQSDPARFASDNPFHCLIVNEFV